MGLVLWSAVAYHFGEELVYPGVSLGIHGNSSKSCLGIWYDLNFRKELKKGSTIYGIASDGYDFVFLKVDNDSKVSLLGTLPKYLVLTTTSGLTIRPPPEKIKAPGALRSRLSYRKRWWPMAPAWQPDRGLRLSQLICTGRNAQLLMPPADILASHFAIQL
ncbi:hypothetical protein PCH_Pc21g16550 [Penicillium rubens Wisconsin 54-1255]|uniref:Uncharacterized protein n=1 Tax=Penicillium rubens (strain ATCC 28089 / DSM 1075 / NRRL 1951 / Wisconsin 54-1255) TaxID=500485 RepID=B6HLD1_PENRW|nr:hypothetical protein PCH_Pc21g16550 [Penicillium rubens Wisconsin 54-1255]